jgi:uncharacterized protein
MSQWWRDLLFAHWPIQPAVIQSLLPPGLIADTIDNQAWAAVVPFRMTGVRPRGVPRLPWVSDFSELNVRTYVRPANHPNSPPGVYFFSLEASNPLAVAVARRFFHLPYMNADMDCQGTAEIAYTSIRTHANEPLAAFEARYRPTKAATRSPLLDWLTERYCLYTTDRQGRLYQGNIHHQRWPLFEAEAEIPRNTMAAAAGIELPATPPLLHFAREIEVLIYPLQRLP